MAILFSQKQKKPVAAGARQKIKVPGRRGSDERQSYFFKGKWVWRNWGKGGCSWGGDGR